MVRRLCHKAGHTPLSVIFPWDRGSYLGDLLCAWWSFDCVFVAPPLCIQEVSGRPGLESRIPEESLGSRGPVLPSGPCWAAREASHEDSRMGRGKQHRSKWAEEVLGRLLPSHWQDLVNVLPPRVAAQLTHTNLSPVHLPGRLRSQAVSIAGHKRFPAGGERRMVGG